MRIYTVRLDPPDRNNFAIRIQDELNHIPVVSEAAMLDSNGIKPVAFRRGQESLMRNSLKDDAALLESFPRIGDEAKPVSN